MKNLQTYYQFLNEGSVKNLKDVKPNKFLYHTSNPSFRDSITKQGLIPKGKSEAWLSDTNIDGEVIFAVNSDNKKDWWDSTYDDDIYRIDTTKLDNKWYCDPNFDMKDHRIITFEKIPSSSIKLIHKGSGATIPDGYTKTITSGSVKEVYYFPNTIPTKKTYNEYKK